MESGIMCCIHISIVVLLMWKDKCVMNISSSRTHAKAWECVMRCVVLTAHAQMIDRKSWKPKIDRPHALSAWLIRDFILIASAVTN